MNFVESYPETKEAKAYMKHRNFSNALKIYVDILEEINQDSEEYPYILLEYSKCMLESIIFQSEMNYLKIIQTRNSSGIREEELEEDLENCWESLEICRINFESMGENGVLVEVHKALGDVLGLKNLFDEAIKEYQTAINYNNDEINLINLLECIGESYKNLKLYDESIGYYRQISNIYQKANDLKLKGEVDSLIEGLEMLKDGYENGDEEVNENLVEYSINHLKR